MKATKPVAAVCVCSDILVLGFRQDNLFLRFLSWLFQMCIIMVSGNDESTPSIIYHCVLRGLERLLLSEQLSRLDSESLVKLSVDRVNVHSPHRAMAALGLMLTCMYTGLDIIKFCPL